MDDPLRPVECARVLRALAARERLCIVRCLFDGARTVSEIADLLRLPMANLSHHLQVLREARIVQSRKRGRYVVNYLRPGLLRPRAGDSVALDLGCCRLVVPTGGGPDPVRQ